MNDWQYFKVRPDFNGGHLPANRELVGCYIGYPEENRHEIYRYPTSTTISFSLMTHSYNTYEQARDEPPYEGSK